MSTSPIKNPLDALIAQAKQKEAKMAENREQERQAAEERRKAAADAYRKEQEAKEREEQIKSFSECFLGKVGNYVFKPKWSTTYMELIKDYALGLLNPQDNELPVIKADYHVDAILEQFKRALPAFPMVPDGYFYGQRLLEERNSSKTPPKPKPIRRVAVSATDSSDQSDQPTSPKTTGAAQVIELPSATTPKGTKGGRPGVKAS